RAARCVAGGSGGLCFPTGFCGMWGGGEPPPFLRGIDQAVRPYVFEPRGGGERLPRGGSLEFDLLLFGQAVELQAYAALALERTLVGYRSVDDRATSVLMAAFYRHL